MIPRKRKLILPGILAAVIAGAFLTTYLKESKRDRANRSFVEANQIIVNKLIEQLIN
ncbi:MAG: hypothetical protein QF632_03900 [Candidatus Woesearchaeota archaeon]|jgi:hypothetical protein|nr:hypothetical protein [Candidatus Woesearchaeota archaeon]MDP7323874.1 hypothetical protein [Candidatus Woesearchaeota archaeon]MDP7458458.1 hypothetical protein [Candidatus Woesearchaeota archaeon]|tara:strand:- start:235 stop:405 length:171 start_codon:yes stop_codon:yes gene_type:complete